MLYQDRVHRKLTPNKRTSIYMKEEAWAVKTLVSSGHQALQLQKVLPRPSRSANGRVGQAGGGCGENTVTVIYLMEVFLMLY